MAVVTQNARLNGTRLIKIESAGPAFPETDWVDPAREDIVVACEQSPRTNSRRSISSLEYRRDPQLGWVPWRWTQTSVADPKSYRGEGTVSTFTVNERIDADKFVLRFPPRTTVVDRERLEKYVVAPDGSKSRVTKIDLPAH